MSNTEQSYQVQSHVKKGCVEHANDGLTSSGDGVTKNFRTRFFYNSAIHPAKIDAVLASDFRRNNVKSHKNLKIEPRVFRASTRSSNQNHSSKKLNTCVSNCNVIEVCKTASTHDTGVVNHVYTASDSSIGVHQVGSPSRPCSVNTSKSIEPLPPDDQNQTCLLYDRHLNGIDDKFINSILHNVGRNNGPQTTDSHIFKQLQEQSEFAFSFIPHSEQVMPDVVNIASPVGFSAFEIHALVRATGKYNYMGARTPVNSQLNVAAWKAELGNYWDQQLLQLIEFGFPLDFNRHCPLKFEGENHASAIQYPADIEAYLQEEYQFYAILGPFK